MVFDSPVCVARNSHRSVKASKTSCLYDSVILTPHLTRPCLSCLVPFWRDGVLFRFVSRIALSASKTLQHHKLFIVTEALQCSTSTLNYFFFQARHLCDLHPFSPAPTLFFFYHLGGSQAWRGCVSSFSFPLSPCVCDGVYSSSSQKFVSLFARRLQQDATVSF